MRNSSVLTLLCAGLVFGCVSAFFPSRVNQHVTAGSSWKKSGSIEPAVSKSSFQLQERQDPSERTVFGSKLLPDLSEEELEEMFKEFNITSAWDINKDPELAKWGPSKEFFETYGFQNNTEKYKRKTMHVKMDFYSNYTKPILPQYKTFIADVMSMTFVQSMDSRYKYDALHAFGICTQYYTIMKGYALQDEIDEIFNQMMKAVGFDPNKIREDAKRVLTMVKQAEMTEDDLLNGQTGELAEIFNYVRGNRFFKYTDAWGVGLGRLIELVGGEPNLDNFKKYENSFRWVFAQRLVSTWDEFCGDQLRMQGIEAMQKQLMIREKKRQAAKLEKKAAGFEDKKKALQELNEAVEERRAQLIEEQKMLKKKYEPEEYERLVAAEKKASA